PPSWSEAAILQCLAPAVSLPTNYYRFGHRSAGFLHHPLVGNSGTVAICVTFREKSRVSMRGCTALSGTLWKDRSNPHIGIVMSRQRPLIKGYFAALRLIGGA